MSDAGTTVEAYSGYRYGERPRAFTWRGERYQVLSVERRWRTSQGYGFIVRAACRSTDDAVLKEAGDEERPGQRWELTYNEVQDAWHVRRADIDDDRHG